MVEKALRYLAARSGIKFLAFMTGLGIEVLLPPTPKQN